MTKPLTTAERILRSAGKVVQKDGADAVTMRRVATAVGITPMALYKHFANRDALLTAIANQGFTLLSTRLHALLPSGDTERDLAAILDTFLDFAFELPHLYQLMFLTPREGARRFPEDFRAGNSPTASPSADVIASAMERGFFRKDDVWEIVFEAGALQQGLVMLYLGGRVSLTQEEFRAFCHRSFRRYMHGLLS